MLRPVTRIILTLAAASLVLAAPIGAVAKDGKLDLKDNYFSKPFLVVTVGDTVTWKNKGDLGHTVVSYRSAPASFDSSPGTGDDCTPLLSSADCVEPDESFAVTFTTPGVYEYFCKIDGHADTSVRPDPAVKNGREQPCGMCGLIQVNSDEEPPPPTASPKPVIPTRSPSPSPSASGSESPSPTPDADPSVGPDGSPLAAGERPGGGDGAGGRVALAFLGIAVLGGAGYVVWRRYLATS